MMVHAWQNYVEFAWGENELRPVTRTGHSAGIFGKSKLGATIVDAMDTLYIMGLMEEFEAGRQWIEQELTLEGVVRKHSSNLLVTRTKTSLPSP
jgi:mannosyl-oligosaccharide alpha-1,2-mannosidase